VATLYVVAVFDSLTFYHRNVFFILTHDISPLTAQNLLAALGMEVVTFISDGHRI